MLGDSLGVSNGRESEGVGDPSAGVVGLGDPGGAGVGASVVSAGDPEVPLFEELPEVPDLAGLCECQGEQKDSRFRSTGGRTLS